MRSLFCFIFTMVFAFRGSPISGQDNKRSMESNIDSILALLKSVSYKLFQEKKLRKNLIK